MIDFSCQRFFTEKYQKTEYHEKKNYRDFQTPAGSCCTGVHYVYRIGKIVLEDYQDLVEKPFGEGEKMDEGGSLHPSHMDCGRCLL